MLASLVSSATPKAPFIPPVWARLMWHATPSTLGSSKPSMTILSLGPSSRNLVLTAPVVPRSGRAMIHTLSRTTTSTTTVPELARAFSRRPSHLLRLARRSFEQRDAASAYPLCDGVAEKLHDPRQIDLDAHDVVQNLDPSGDPLPHRRRGKVQGVPLPVILEPAEKSV